jgi:hypothetical protein
LANYLASACKLANDNNFKAKLLASLKSIEIWCYFKVSALCWISDGGERAVSHFTGGEKSQPEAETEAGASMIIRLYATSKLKIKVSRMKACSMVQNTGYIIEKFLVWS